MPTALWATNSGVIGTTRTSPVWMRLSRGVSPVERCWPMHPPSITMATVGTAKARSRLFTLASSLLERHRQSFDYLVRVDGPIRRHREWKPKGHARVHDVKLGGSSHETRISQPTEGAGPAAPPDPPA